MNANRIIEKEPQMDADELRYKLVTESGAAHRKGCKERKTQPQNRERMTLIHRFFANPCKSAQSVKSVFYRFSSRIKSTDMKAYVAFRANPQFFEWVIFQTGITGFTGYGSNPVHPVILLKW